MRTPQLPRRVSTRAAGIGMAGLLVAGLAAVAGPTLASAQASGGGMSMAGMDMAAGGSSKVVGDTDGWLHGERYNLHYTQRFFCKEPPTSAADSHCELGAGYDAIPSSEFDPLYVIVPIGFTPKNPYTLQCPTAGNCVSHPHRIDLTRVFGSGTGNALLPPHSHVLTTAAGGAPEWWNVDVIGVTTQAAWHQIVVAKSYSRIQAMRVAGNPGVTDNIGTNLFLFFSVQEK